MRSDPVIKWLIALSALSSSAAITWHFLVNVPREARLKAESEIWQANERANREQERELERVRKFDFCIMEAENRYTLQWESYCSSNKKKRDECLKTASDSLSKGLCSLEYISDNAGSCKLNSALASAMSDNLSEWKTECQVRFGHRRR